MTYQKGSTILAADFDGFLTTASNVYGVGSADRGYGQTAISQSAVSAGQAILASQWLNLRSMVVVCANQQGTPITNLPPSTVFVAGLPVVAEEQASPSSQPYELAAYVTAIDTNRLNVSNTSLSIQTGVWTITRSTSWTTITGQVSATWANENSARYFFNSGGQIRMTGSHPTGTTEDDHWHNTLASVVGTIKFAVHATSNTGSSGTDANIGYYELTDSFQTIYSYTVGGGGGYYYAGEVVTVSAKRLNYVGVNGGNGNGVEFQISLSNSGSYYGGSNSAGTSFSFDNAIATTYLSGITAPTYATVTNF